MEDRTPPTTETENYSLRSATVLRELEVRAQAALAASRDHTARLEEEITRQLEELAAALLDQAEAETVESVEVASVREEAAKLRAELEQSRVDWNIERAILESDRDELAQQVAKLKKDNQQSSATDAALTAERDELAEKAAIIATKCDGLIEELAQLKSELEDRSQQSAAAEAERDDLAQQLAELKTERETSVQRAASLEAAQRATKDEWQSQLKDFEGKLADQGAAWNSQRTAWASERQTLQEERDELQQKFELALEDVQRYRSRATDLEQDLARRPEASQADSAELVALRAERDALADRVEELENQPAAAVDDSNEQQMDDLRRRFELAVEDVRELKTKNAQLEAQVASAGKKSHTPADSGSMDWESQKRRLLASLEDEGNADDEPARRKERLTIENTIEMTDSVIAEKDSEIAALKARLTASAEASHVESHAAHTAQLNELLDADEVIAEHRKRIADLEREMDATLRAAELEISIERAKLARQKAELEDMRAEIDTRRSELGGGGDTTGAPRRRWLSKLGLSGEE
jgi:chromosome segregation ATPase